MSAIDETDEVVSDDDASLYRLFGFALFVGINFRKILCMVALSSTTFPLQGGSTN